METLTQCPNCKSDLKSGIFSSNELVEVKKTAAINALTDNKSEAHCEKCYPPLIQKAKANYNSAVPALKAQLKQLVPSMPILTLQQPHKWDYQVLK